MLPGAIDGEPRPFAFLAATVSFWYYLVPASFRLLLVMHQRRKQHQAYRHHHHRRTRQRPTLPFRVVRCQLFSAPLDLSLRWAHHPSTAKRKAQMEASWAPLKACFAL